MAYKITIYNDTGVGEVQIVRIAADRRVPHEVHTAQGGENPKPVCLELRSDDVLIVRPTD